MPVYSGKYRYLGEGGAAIGQGPCRLTFDEETCIVTPESGAPLAFDLGDIEAAAPDEFDLQLTLYTGRTVELRGFGKLQTAMSEALLAAWRNRTVRCLTLEDLEETGRYTGTASLDGCPPVRAQIRLYRSNLAVIPLSGAPLNQRLGEVDSVHFDETSYSIVIDAGSQRLTIGKLAKKTEEFAGALRGTVDTLRTQAAGELHKLFPFLGPDPLQRLLTVMPEGRSVRVAGLAAIHPKLPAAFLERAVDAPLKPYFLALSSAAVKDGLMAGYKFIRKEDAETEAEATEEAEAVETPGDEAAAEPEIPEEEPEEEKEGQPILFWFFFPMAGKIGHANAVAWEASTGAGRATYVFRVVPPGQEAALADPSRAAAIVEDSVGRITRALGLVNFRREPVYLPDASLEQQPRYRRYAIAARRLPELRDLRAAYAGRAIHSSLDAWRAQVRSLTS